MRAVLILTVLLVSGWAHGADLRRPVKPAPPTLLSEIRRGADAAFGCQIANSAHPLESEPLLQCLREQQRTNRQQMGRGYGAFESGLWFAGRGRLRGLVAVAPSARAASSLDVAVAGLREAELVLGVSDDDVWRALHTSSSGPRAVGPASTGRSPTARSRSRRPCDRSAASRAARGC